MGIDQWTRVMSTQQVEPDEVFNTAMCYLTAYRYMSQMIQPVKNLKLTVAASMPIMSMCALVTELELKVFHALDHDRIPKSHDLADLYRNLKMPSRIAIKKAWVGELPKWRKIHSQMEERFGGKIKEDLVEVLEAGRRGFEKYRYSFEEGDDAGEDFLLHPLPELLRATLIARRPNWINWTPRAPKWIAASLPPKT